MKTLLTLLIFAFTLMSTTIVSVQEKFEGTYDGMTEDMEFQFTADNGTVYVFYEMDEGVEFDLSEGDNVGQKFNVTWETREVEVWDDETEETSNVEVKVITGLEKL